MNIYTSYTSFSQWSQFKSHGKKKCQIHPSWQMFQGSWPNGNLGGGGGFNKPWPPGLGGKQTSPWRSESWIHGVGRAFMSFHSQSAFMSFHIFISFVLYHTTQSVSHFWIKQMVFRNSTQKKNTTTIVQRKDPPLLRSNAEPEYWNSVGGAFGGETSGEKRINLFRRLMDDRKQSDPK